jgi:signal transduction histidine kinase/ligand-binding sensor domain-containing protein/AraC-like DNA-binding protein/ActR/RegA family two-component response regulator
MKIYRNALFKKKRVVFSIPLFFFLVTNGILLFAQPENLRFENYTVENGLSSNIIQCAFHDRKGWMWFGTREGLNRFDGYKFISYLPDSNDSLSLKGQLVRCITEDRDGNLWVGTENGALNRFNYKKNNFSHFFVGKSVNAVLADKGGILWVGTNTGLYKFNPNTGKLIEYSATGKNPASLRNNFVRTLAKDKQGNIWIGTNKGIDILNVAENKIAHFTYSVTNLDDEIWSIFIGEDGLICFGTYNTGFFIYNTVSKNLDNFYPDRNYRRSFTIRSIVEDKKGFYWIGTRGGVYLFNKRTRKFSHFENIDREPSSLCNNSIANITLDRKGDIWISTRGGISYMAQEKQIFRLYKSFVNDDNYLNNSEIYAFWLENNNSIWIGTENGGINILDRNSGKYRYISGNALSSNTIKAFAEDKQGHLWVATFLGGADVIDIKSRRVIAKHLHNPADSGSIMDNRVWSVLSDKNGNLWLGTDEGVDRFNFKTQKFEHFNNIARGNAVQCIKEDPEHDIWFFSNKSFSIYNPNTHEIRHYAVPGRSLFVDSKGRYWLPSYYKGLILFDKQKGVLKIYNEKDGLPSIRTFCVLEDRSGYLWISSEKGLSKFDPGKGQFINYDKRDGLQGNQFNYGAVLQLPSGEFIFGGVNGFNLFNPGNVKPHKYIAPLVFTDFRVFYKPVPISDAKNAVLHEDISEAKSITLPYDQNVFTIEFSTLNYAQSHKSNYAYKLEGFDKDWNEIGEKHTAIYTNLNPGSYVFYVKSWNSDNLSKIQKIKLSIKITPPFWGTLWFKAFLVLLMLGIIYVLVCFLTYKSRLKQELIMERAKARQLHELDLMKMKFFTNISHEIRTPLTLIVGPVEKMLTTAMSENEQKSHLNIVYRNAQQLLRLVNQLLDFRKIESGNLKLEMKWIDIVDYINIIVGSFEQMAHDKGIILKVYAVQKEIFSFFDPEKVEKIINNLLSNALKFTNRGGSVHISISLILDNQDETADVNGNRYIEIVVKDTGIGISESNLEKIFYRFFQLKDSTNQTGTGIGLSLTKELVKLHHGRICVESIPQKGTRFTVLLPFIVSEQEIEPHNIESVDLANPDDVLMDVKEMDENIPDKILLIVEDNMDVRFFIHSHFEHEYKILEAADGKEGLNIAFKHIPDIIISDVMMPGTDGIELCKKLKKDERTSHIPIILLTALTSKESIQQGLSAGADDYITKPFDISLLHTKVENLFTLRRSLQMKYSGELLLQPKNITLTSPDERFLKKAIETVEKYIDDADLDSDQFAQYLGVSRMQLYRKIGALTDMTVKDFIRDLRLKRAAQLLVQNKLNISEVAYSVGFKDLAHFRRCFRQEFGMTATEYVKKFGD